MQRIILLLLITLSLYGSPFSLIKKENNPYKEPTLLVIGGIHGNEPGSYFASAILSEYYQITKGNLWIVPDLNRDSIWQNNRGVNGDMNRKFANIDANDSDYEILQEIKKIIIQPQIGLILNLHDGHGFYRKEYQNTIFNPNAWGQTCVIDQGTLDSEHPFGNLNDIAAKVSTKLNNELIEEHHFFDVRNTNTRFDDEAMKHSLTYYAVNQSKPAFAIETSKNLPTLHHKVFYQLRAIESYMEIMGIEFERSFTLTLNNVKSILENHGNLIINNNFNLGLKNLKNSLSFIPLQSDSNTFKFTHPLGSIQKNKQNIDLYIGNQKIGTLIPNYQPHENCSDFITVIADGNIKTLAFATDFFVSADFMVVNNDPTMRVNIIGFTKKGVKDEGNLHIGFNDLDPKYSIDTKSKSYRVEFYRQNHFCGMVLVNFK